MCDEKFECDEAIFWENDPPQNEDEEPEEGAAPDDGEDGDDDDDLLAPTGDGDIRPPGTIGGGG